MKTRLMILWLSVKWMFRMNLGDYVWYKGKKYVVLNGVRCDSWRLAGLQNGDEGWVPRNECRKSWTPRNLYGSFCSGYGFYMQNWYLIWKREGIQDWMKACSIW